MQFFNRSPRRIEFCLNVRKTPEVRAVFNGVAAYDDAFRRKEFGTWIPYDIHSLPQIGKAAINIVFLFPEASRLPGNLITGVITRFANQGLHIGREIRVNRLHYTKWHRAN